MFTVGDMIFSSIAHTALHQMKLEKIKTHSAILSKNVFSIAGNDNALFYIDDNIITVQEVMDDYNFSDLRPTDKVLDIGACIGAFSLNIYKNVNHVYAVEPLMTGALERNIVLNNAKNITVLNCALGEGEIDIEWYDRTKKIRSLSLGEIIKQCGGHIDFIKCDCEGGEWSMTLTDIFNVRRIEAELHNFKGLYNFRDFENLLISSGFEYTKRLKNKHLMLISAKNKYID